MLLHVVGLEAGEQNWIRQAARQTPKDNDTEAVEPHADGGDDVQNTVHHAHEFSAEFIRQRPDHTP